MNSEFGFLAMKNLRRDYGMQFEILVSQIYKFVIKPNSTVIDGGANAGLHAIPMANLIADLGNLYCFEPNPKIFKRLQSNLAAGAAGSNVKAFQMALSSQPGEMSFVVNDENPALSHLTHEYDNVGGKEVQHERIKVQTTTLDIEVSKKGVDFIKLDLEGADVLALFGARAILENDKPICVFENSREWASKCYGYSKEDFFEFFENLNYETFDLHGRLLTPDTWKTKDLAFEFVAIHKDSALRAKVLYLIQSFWSSIGRRPELNRWEECVAACKNSDYWQPDFCGFDGDN